MDLVAINCNDRDNWLPIKDKCNDRDNWLPIKDMDIVIGTYLAVSKVKKDKTRQELCYAFRQGLRQIATYMQTVLPVENPVL